MGGARSSWKGFKQQECLLVFTEEMSEGLQDPPVLVSDASWYRNPTTSSFGRDESS